MKEDKSFSLCINKITDISGFQKRKTKQYDVFVTFEATAISPKTREQNERQYYNNMTS